VIETRLQDTLATWLCDRLKMAWTPELRCIGRIGIDGRILGAVGFVAWSATAVEVHMAGDGGHWGSRALIKAGFDYAFRVYGAKVLIGCVPSGNVAAKRLNEHLGFKITATISDAHPDGALHIMTLRREDCRYFKD